MGIKGRRHFCNHYRAMSEHSTCEVGVPYDKFEGMPFDVRPCFCREGESPRTGCDLMQIPTTEEIAERDAEVAKRMEGIGKARKAIIEHLGGPWKKGTPSARGQIDCPVCLTPNFLTFSRAGYNGHIHAACRTAGCVSWME